MKQWPRARVIEINRLSSRKRWWFIPGPKNIADIGTREGVQIKDVLDGSEWREGYEWMRQEEKDFPMMSVECISFPSIREQVNAEMHKNGPILEAIEVMYSEPAQNLIPITYLTFSKLVPESVGERYKFRKYLIDPNKYRLKRVVRLMALVKRFIRKIKTAVKKRDIKSQLNTEYGVEFSPCPAGAHYMHGRVERKIRQVRESLERSAAGQKLSTIGWETVLAEIANCINDLPIGLANRNVDLIYSHPTACSWAETMLVALPNQ